MISGGSLEDVAGVVEFRLDHVLSNGEGGWFVLGASVLFSAEEDVAGNSAVGGGEEFSERREEGQGDAMFVTRGHEGGGGGIVPTEGDDAVEVVKRDAQLCFAFEFHRGRPHRPF